MTIDPKTLDRARVRRRGSTANMRHEVGGGAGRGHARGLHMKRTRTMSHRRRLVAKRAWSLAACLAAWGSTLPAVAQQPPRTLDTQTAVAQPLKAPETRPAGTRIVQPLIVQAGYTSTEQQTP